MKKWNELTGKRLLVTDGITGIGRSELTLLEISPNKKIGKFRNEIHNTVFRSDLDDCEVLDVLAPVFKPTPTEQPRFKSVAALVATLSPETIAAYIEQLVRENATALALNKCATGVAEEWIAKLERNNATLLDFVNRERHLTPDDPRIVALKKSMESAPTP